MSTKTLVSAAIIALLLTACNDTERNLQIGSGKQATEQSASNPATTQADAEADAANAAHQDAMQALVKELDDGTLPDHTPAAKPISLPDGRVQVDWDKLDTKVTPIDPASFHYPFAPDSQPVMNYARQFNINPSQAQHAMVLSMASPEALSKILDQLTGYYKSHELTDGAEMTLVIHTNNKVVGETHDYVFADKFAEGLVLPIKIVPDE